MAVAVLACSRIGAIHSVVFGGFSPEALASRTSDCAPRLIITADGAFRGGKVIPLKKNVDDALQSFGSTGHSVEKVIVVKRVADKIKIEWDSSRDLWWHELHNDSTVQEEVEPVAMDAEDPLFILYLRFYWQTKGVLHTTAGYLLGATLSTYYVFDLKEDDVYWCTADVGWITGIAISYMAHFPMGQLP